MAQKVSQEELHILQAVEKLPFTDEDKIAWKEIIQESGANEELVKDILAKSSELTTAQMTAADEGETHELARNTAELTRHIHSWRLEQNLRNLNNRGNRGNRGRQRRR